MFNVVLVLDSSFLFNWFVGFCLFDGIRNIINWLNLLFMLRIVMILRRLKVVWNLISVSWGLKLVFVDFII